MFQTPKLSDLPALQAHLIGCNLPASDIEPHLDHFLIHRVDSAIVGSAGFERLGDLGLFRSLAVAQSFRGRGLAFQLLTAISRKAWDDGIKEFYLLTIDAETYFQRVGFQVVQRKDVPQRIQSTQSFQTLCPGTATVMHCKVEDINLN